MVAAEKTPSVKAGRIRERRPSSAPPVGIQPSFTAKSMMSMMPSQKAGMHWPSRASTRITASETLLRFTAATMPAGMPSTTEMSRDRKGGRRPLQHHGHGRFIVVVGGAEIPHQRPLQKADILDGQGVIEAHLFTEDLHFLFGGGGGDHQLHRVPGEVQDKKYDYGNAQDRDDGLPEPLE